MNGEASRLHVQLFADLFSDLDQVCAAFARLRSMAVLDARQFWWQYMAASVLAR